MMIEMKTSNSHTFFGTLLTKIQSRSAALLASAALVLLASGASAAPQITASTGKINPSIYGLKGAEMLYNQNSDSLGQGVDSQNFTSGNSTYALDDDSGADDFVVPKGQVWTVTEVDATGFYFNGSGPAMSENVIFYANSKGLPGHPVKGGTFDDLSCTDTSGAFSCPLGKGVKLKAGHYWVAVVANCSFEGGCGEWAWEGNSRIKNKPAVWENPNGGFWVCFTWEQIDNCGGGERADLMFDLQGTEKEK